MIAKTQIELLFAPALCIMKGCGVASHIFFSDNGVARKVIRTCGSHRIPAGMANVREITPDELADLQDRNSVVGHANLGRFIDLGFAVIPSTNSFDLEVQWRNHCNRKGMTAIFVRELSQGALQIEWAPYRVPGKRNGQMSAGEERVLDSLYKDLGNKKPFQGRMRTELDRMVTPAIMAFDQAKEFAQEIANLEKIVRDPDLWACACIHES